MFGFRRRKEKEEKINPLEIMQSMIWTTARTRQSKYYEWRLGNISEEVAQNVWERYLKEYGLYQTWGVYPLNENILNKVEDMFKQEERRQKEIAEQQKAEYGM